MHSCRREAGESKYDDGPADRAERADETESSEALDV
jgi:hypothetical protein